MITTTPYSTAVKEESIPEVLAKIKSFAMLSLFLLASTLLYAQPVNLFAETETADEAELAKKVSEKSASTAVKPVWDINDSLLNIPAYDEYCKWTSKKVHPYEYDLTNKSDTTVIPLIETDSCDYSFPIHGKINSEFGPRRYRYHYGVDVDLHHGDTVKAAFEGIVRVSHYDMDYGRVVVLRHKNGLETLYAHFSKLLVSPGDWVQAGMAIGLGGSSGRSTGNHLHFECRYLGEPLDPNDLIDFTTGQLKDDTLMLSSDNFSYLKELRARKYHIIRRGDSLWKIARRYGTTIRHLCRLNGIRPSTTLRIGNRIRYN